MIINKSKEVYYPNGNLKAGGINDSDLKYAVPKNFNGGGSSDGGTQLFELREIKTTDGSYFDGEQVNELVDKKPLSIVMDTQIFYKSTDQGGSSIAYVHMTPISTRHIIILKGNSVLISGGLNLDEEKQYFYDADSGNYVLGEGGGGIS